MTILSWRRIHLAIFLYEQFKHLTRITLRPNIQLLSKPQHAYHSSFWVTSWFDSVYNILPEGNWTDRRTYTVIIVHTCGSCKISIPSLIPGGGGEGEGCSGILWYFYTYVGSGHFWGVQNFEFQFLGGFQKNEYFLGYQDFVDIFGGTS